MRPDTTPLSKQIRENAPFSTRRIAGANLTASRNYPGMTQNVICSIRAEHVFQMNFCRSVLSLSAYWNKSSNGGSHTRSLNRGKFSTHLNFTLLPCFSQNFNLLRPKANSRADVARQSLRLRSAYQETPGQKYRFKLLPFWSFSKRSSQMKQ